MQKTKYEIIYNRSCIQEGEGSIRLNISHFFDSTPFLFSSPPIPHSLASLLLVFIMSLSLIISFINSFLHSFSRISLLSTLSLIPPSLMPFFPNFFTACYFFPRIIFFVYYNFRLSYFISPFSTLFYSPHSSFLSFCPSCSFVHPALFLSLLSSFTLILFSLPSLLSPSPSSLIPYFLPLNVFRSIAASSNLKYSILFLFFPLISLLPSSYI